MHQQPYYDINCDEKSGICKVFFALRLNAIVSSETHASNKPSELASTLNRQVDFIATLPSIGEGSAIELRLVSQPDELYPHKGQVHVYLRLRINTILNDNPTETAEKAFKNIKTNLVILSDLYHWQSVSKKEEYETVFSNSDTKIIAEIMRREACMDLERIPPITAKHPIGFNNTLNEEKPLENDSSVHFVFPYIRTYNTLERLFDALLNLKESFHISLALSPTSLTEQEINYLRTQIEHCELFLQRGSRYDDPSGEIIPPLRHQAQLVLNKLQQFTLSLLDNSYQMKAQIASQHPIPSGLIDALGGLITEPVSSRDDYSDVIRENDNLSGGYDWSSPQSEKELQKAYKNFNDIEFYPWQDSNDGNETIRLRLLADATQANAVFRFPLPGNKPFPGLKTYLSTIIAPPPNLAVDGIHLGNNHFRGQQIPVFLSRDDRRRHMYMVGKTGTGKSSLMLQMLMQDIEDGEGCCALDPHGELIEDVLERIPKERINDVVLIDPTDEESVVGLNLFEFRDSIDRDSAINHLFEIFDQLYDMKLTGGPVFEQYLRNSAYLVTSLADRTANLSDIQRVFSDRYFLRHLINECDDPLVKSFWEDVALKTRSSDYSLIDVSVYITSKLSRFIFNNAMRPILLQRKSTIDFVDMMDTKKIVLVNLAKGKLGMTNSRFLGMIILSLLERAAFARANRSEIETLPDFYLYVDEFQNLAMDSFISMLSEARKYRLNIIITNQYLSQIPEAVKNAVLGNVGTLLTFRTGQRDAEILEQEFGKKVSDSQITGLSNYNAYLTTLVNGEATMPFSLKTILVPSEPSQLTAQNTRLASNKNFARSRASITDAIMDEWNKISNRNKERDKKISEAINKT